MASAVKNYLSSILILLVVTSGSYAQELKNKPKPEAIALNNRASRLNAMHLPGSKQVDTALILLDSALKIDNHYAIAYSNMTSIYVERKNYPMAIRTMRKFEVVEPTNPELLFYLGIMLEKTGELKKSREKFIKAEALNKLRLNKMNVNDKHYEDTLINYAGDLIFLNRSAEAEKILTKILTKNPKQMAALALKGKTKEHLLNEFK
ncbi:hypothetical protein [Pedobacter cryoconitis]|uniref:Tetratricopeptide (TPR) repeat protein n=1 Tax=Pedobacter cryoconitis TaxID=188932 RepID=A0A7X0MKW6_9SPHI|nr:hypothetical protein [Pedobacter cryoconitis]MBB6502624.1 tetratricopeptide (TPR) repeat protein [Pedobacter cryoconitis]